MPVLPPAIEEIETIRLTDTHAARRPLTHQALYGEDGTVRL